MKLIGISGKIGTGKSTLAVHLIDKLNGWVLASFGQLLKEECSKMTKIPLGHFYNDKGSSYPMRANYPAFGTHFVPPAPTMSVREIMQWWGTDVRRAGQSDYWVERMGKILDQNKLKGVIGTVIDDMRFVNEADLTLCHGGYLVRLDQHGSWSCSREIAGHQSETDLDSYTKWSLKFAPAYGNLEAVADLIVHQMGVK